MKTLTSILILLAIASRFALAQTIPSYYSTTDLSFTSPGALKFGLYGFDNPALLTYVRRSDLQFTWTDEGGKWNDFNRWGLFTAGPHFGFGFIKTKLGPASIIDYRISTAFGDRTASLGLAYGFTGGDKSAFDRRNTLSVGSLVRPDAHISLGLIGTVAMSGNRTEGIADLGVRPFGNELLTLFGDFGVRDDRTLREGNWSYGLAVEPLPGIRFTGRYFDTHGFAVGLSFSLGRAGFSGQTTFDKDSHHRFNTYAVRLGAFDRTVMSGLTKNTKFVALDLNGTMNYQRFILFDRGNTLMNTLEAIAAATNDESIAGIAINTSGMNVNREMLWELREALKRFRSAGKKVVIFIDRVSIDGYRLASVADKIVLDPAGMIMLPGYLMGNTYLKGTLEKLGIGFDELRYFKYKSADETFSREKMSDADREQRQKYIEDVYAAAKTDICEGRGFNAGKFDELVNNKGLFLPKDALKEGLVDTLGRWDDVQSIVDRISGRSKPIAGIGSLAQFNLPYDATWGEPPHIAVIYALGACAMDEGIKARSLVKDVLAAGDDRKIKAIVLRVDSPGGDALASDYIAEAVKKARRNKPVIVSQGFVAGSGGYWLSMDADTIVAAPGTITGSIGVIAGWLYNTELKEKLGMSTDYVKVGTYADMGFGFRLPFLGVGIPDRDLTADERAKAERAIKTLYEEFVAKVAAGRKSTPEKIEEIAQGRFYSGTEGKSNGLVDILGGLQDAIRVARDRAGIPPGAEVTIVEMPKPGLLNLRSLFSLPSASQQSGLAEPVLEQLKFRLQHNGQPIPLMPLNQIQLDVSPE
jgi:protease-4